MFTYGRFTDFLVWWLEDKPLLNPVKFSTSLNLTYSKLYIIYILKQFYTFSIGFDFQQCLLFMYNEGVIYNNIFKQSKPVIYSGFCLEMRFPVSFGFALFTSPFPYHPDFFCTCIYLKWYFFTFDIIVLFRQEGFFIYCEY